jgi:putative FmdB family regulatory protein
MTDMAVYEYRCTTCATTFELRRTMSQSNDPATCPDGHVGAKRMLSVFASVGGGASSAGAPAPAVGQMGGGCGGHCACH